MQTLQGKFAVVTGAGDGMGRAIALMLDEAGAGVALVGRTPEKLRQTAASMKGKSLIMPCDLRDSAAIEVAADVLVKHAPVDILVHCAGIWHKPGAIDELSMATIDDVLRTNLVSVMQLTHFLLPSLRTRPEAAIVAVISKMALSATQGRSAYAASKWGVRGFIDSLKQDLRGTGVQVTGLYPAGTRTNLFDAAQDPRVMDAYTDPRDIAEAVRFVLTRVPAMWVTDMMIDHS